MKIHRVLSQLMVIWTVALPGIAPKIVHAEAGYNPTVHDPVLQECARLNSAEYERGHAAACIRRQAAGQMSHEDTAVLLRTYCGWFFRRPSSDFDSCISTP